MARGGVRPNSGRKPKADEERLRDLLNPYVPEAIECVVNIMRNGEKDADKLQAAKLLIAYLYGQPTQAVEHSGDSIHVTFTPYNASTSNENI